MPPSFLDASMLTPSSADEAVTMFGDGAGVTVLAGGTVLVPSMTRGAVQPERVLALSRAGLDRVERDGAVIRIGAAVPVAALLDLPEPLASAAANVADYEVRAQGTIGGNLCAAPGDDFPRGDLQAPLLALGARVRSAGAGGERTQDVEEFLTSGGDGRLVLSIELDDVPRRAAWVALDRPHAHSYTPLAVSAVAEGDGSGPVRVAVSGAGPRGRRLRSVERLLANGTRGVDPAAAGRAALEDVELRDDALASAWYRERMVPVLVVRALDQLTSNREGSA